LRLLLHHVLGLTCRYRFEGELAATARISLTAIFVAPRRRLVCLGTLRLGRSTASARVPLTLSVDDVARLTARHPYVVRRWIREGVLPAQKMTNEQGQPWMIRAADLALVVRRRRWTKKTSPATNVPERLAAVASISGAGRER